MDADTIRVNQLPELLAGRYAEVFQQKVLNKGKYLALLDEYLGGDYYQGQFELDFPGAKDGISFPPFTLAFDYFYKATQRGYWGVVPALGVESFTEEADEIVDILTENVRLEFTRKRRLSSVHRIISTIWYERSELQRFSLDLQVPSLTEREEASEGQQEELLPLVAQQLNVQRQVVYGRKREMEQLARALKARFNRNVILVGPSGVGKTAMVWELVRQAKKRRINGHIWETTASTMIKELTADTGWEDNLSTFCRELMQAGDTLFIRNLLELFEVGQYVGNEVSMAEYMRPFVARGELTLISECTEEELARIELRSPNYLSYFQIIRLEEPKEDLEDIIIKKVSALARSRRLQLEPEAIKETIRLNRRFTPYSGLPGKPIRFLESLLINKTQDDDKIIGRKEVIGTFCEETGMPVFMVDPEIPMKPKAIKADFNGKLFGQLRAVDSIVDLLASVKTALTRTGKPIASFLFVGPTGVGKTEMAKLLSEFMFGSRDRMLRFDMSEYSDPYSVLRLAGEHFFSDGVLTSAVRREPFCVLLFDEIEKAHPSFYDLLLQMLSEGRLTDSRGRLVNFCSTIIIMTSNIGAANLQGNRISFSSELDIASVTSHFMSAVQKHFRPELFNRIDQVIPFEPLTQETVRFVVDREISLFKKREGIQFRAMSLSIDDAVLDYISVKGYDSKYGARQLQRTIRELLIIPLVLQLNVVDYSDKLLVKVAVAEEKIDIQVEADPLGLELWLEELEKINQSDYAGELRRQIGRLQEGHVYISLLSRLDILERDKKREGEKFWKKRHLSNEYSYILKTKSDVAALAEKIDGYEEQLSMAVMDIKPYNPTINQQIKDWEAEFFSLKMDLYGHLNPSSNQHILCLYGQAIQPILDFYLELFKAKDFEFEAQTVWYRERYYHEMVLVEETEVDTDGKEQMVTKEQKRAQFIYRPYSENAEKALLPEKSKDVLYGIEFVLKGRCVKLYFADEYGACQWRFSDKDIRNYVVSFTSFPENAPKNIIRKEFYKSTPRRIIEPFRVKDNRLGINREVGRKKHLQPFLEAMDAQFKLRLNAAIL